MTQSSGTKVLFNANNVGQCMWPKCPVQSKSQCAGGKLAAIKASAAKTPLVREDIPGVYCSTGTATCKDLDPKQAYICGSCAVFSEYDLGKGTPLGYFCRDGFAK
ncbi:MAG: hypothetical protein RBT20_14045 [Syntrophales bacterium]|jgi:hypothetical protein|nr:hypothetical protein [Syntrophales bacterium]